MQTFSYTARTTAGVTTDGRISAENVADARQQLRADGLFPLALSQGRIRKKARKRSTSKVRKTDLMLATSQLAIMTQSGVDLADALKNVAEECPNAKLGAALNSVHSSVSEGETVSGALRKQQAVFGESYCVAIQAAESSGRLSEVLQRLTDLLKFEIRLRNTIVGIMTYPVILLAVALLVSAALILFVMPQFAVVFEDLRRPVPPVTQMMLDVSTFCRSHIWYLVIGLAAFATAVPFAFRNEDVRRVTERLMLRVKGIGPALISLACGRSFTLMGTMLQSDITLLDSIGLCKSSTRNRLLKDLFGRIEDDVLEGKPMSTQLTEADFLPPGAAQMLGTAEQTGRLTEVALTIGQFYEEDGERQIRQVMKLMEPAIILSMGVFVAFVVLSIMLPLLDVSTV